MNFTLRQKILLYYGIACVCILILIGSFLSSTLRQARLATIYENFKEQLTHIDFALTNLFKTAEYDLEYLASNHLVRTEDDKEFTNFTTADEATFEYHIGESEQGIVDIFQNYRQTHPYINSVYMGRENGGFVRSHKRARNTPYDPRSRPWYMLAKENPGKIMRTAPYRSVTTSDVNIGIVTALLDEQKQVYGVVGMDVTLANLTKYIENAQVGRKGWMVLFNRDGNILAAQDKEMRFKNISDFGDPNLNVISEQAEGFITFKGHSEDIYLCFHTSPALNWKLAFLMPVHEIDDEISNFINRIILILALSLVLLSAITLLGIQKFVITPLKKLEDHTNLITRTGNLEQEIELRSGDEFEHLALSCNQMVSSIKGITNALIKSEEDLRKHREQLENLVKERTSELRAINEELKEEILARKKIEEALKVDEERLEALLKLNEMKNVLEEELIEFTLEECIRLTKSRVGYLHFYSEDNKTLDLYYWSKEVLKKCKAERDSHYPLGKAGVWADCIRLRQPVIHNDYQSLPDKKGCPEGHFHIIRHMSVPIFDGEKIVAVLGVGNKTDDYDESDARQLSSFLNAMWEILQRKRAEDALIATERKLREYYEALAGLAEFRSQVYPSLKPAFAEITKASAEALSAQRAGIWLYNEDLSGIRCLDLFDAISGQHTEGSELNVKDYPVYFDTLHKEGFISAHNTGMDHRTREMGDTYLAPIGITSKLDIPIRLSGNIEGVMCFENLGSPRKWTIDEENFAISIADFVALVIETNHRRRAEEDLQKRVAWAAGLQRAGQALSECKTIKEVAKVAASAPVKDLGLRMAWVSIREEGGRITTLECSDPDQVNVATIDEFECLAKVFETKKTFFVSDVTNDPPCPGCRSIAEKGKFKSCATFPIMVGDECIATLSIRSQETGPKTGLAQSVPLVEVFCRQVGHVWQQRLAEERLNQAFCDTEEARDRIDGIIKSVADGLIVTDMKNRVVLMNRASEDLLGVRLSELIDRPIEFAIQDKTLKDRLTRTLKEKKTGYTFDFELPGDIPDSPRIMRARTSGIKNKDGQQTGIVTIIHDVTHERIIDRMKTEFISTAAHELRTPLTSIRGFSEILLQRQGIRAREKKKFLTYINDQSVNLTNIINDLLDVSRIESGRGFTLNKTPCSIDEIIRGVVLEFQDQSTKHHFETVFPEESVKLNIDKEKTAQVIQNLLSNAVKYSSEGGLIRVSGKLAGDHYQVSVEDQGKGMTPEQVEKIFDKFYRADPSDTAIPGTGLGMSIVKYLVKAHNGEVWVESEPGKGTVVSFTVPIIRF